MWVSFRVLSEIVCVAPALGDGPRLVSIREIELTDRGETFPAGWMTFGELLRPEHRERVVEFLDRICRWNLRGGGDAKRG